MNSKKAVRDLRADCSRNVQFSIQKLLFLSQVKTPYYDNLYMFKLFHISKGWNLDDRLFNRKCNWQFLNSFILYWLYDRETLNADKMSAFFFSKRE
jgi:hypothetical protein